VLELALMVLRSTVHRGTGHTPAQLVLGSEMVVGDWAVRSSIATQLRADDVVRFEPAASSRLPSQLEAHIATRAVQQRMDSMARLYDDVLSGMADKLRLLRGNTAASAPPRATRCHTFKWATTCACGKARVWRLTH
jgi:hypothetical protein